MDERWVKIEGFPTYSVSDAGRIRNDRTGYILHPSRNYRGYAYVALYTPNGEQKTMHVHAIVGRAFVPNPGGRPILNHRDGNKMNPAASNLEWSTYAENTRHAVDVLGSVGCWSSKRRPVLQLEPLRLFESIAEAARAVKTSPREIRRCIENPNKNYTTHGCSFIDAAIMEGALSC